MAENRKEFYISIGGIKESVQNLETLEGILDKMEKQVDTINKNGGFSVVSKEANKNTKEAIDLAKAEEIANNQVISSYKEKQTAMRTLGKEIKSMTVADADAAKKQQEMINQYNGLNEQLKRFDAAMGNHQRNVGDYRGALKEATMELKNLKGEMVGLDQNSAQFKELAERAGGVADKIGDINAAIKRNASDTKTLDDAINIAKSATAAFTLYKGAMESFGVSTKGAEESMKDLMAAMSMVQSLQALSETLQSSSATAELFQKAMKALGLEFLVTKTNATEAAASTTALATAENGATVATKTLTTAGKALRLMLASLGIGLVIMLVTTLISHWEDLVGWFDKTFPIVKKLGGVFNGLKAVFVGVGKAILNWLVNPIKTFANVIQKIFQGDLPGALEAAKEGIKNQFVGTAKAFKEGFQEQVERGLEEITKKNLEETNKQTQQQLKELKIQERNNKTYSKKYIDLQKKDFAERKKLAKGNQEELNKIKLEEMQFFADVEDKKTAAAKEGAKEREKANKEVLEAAKKAVDKFKAQVEGEMAYSAALDEMEGDALKQIIKELEVQLDALSEGPIEKYKAKIDEWAQANRNLEDSNNEAFRESLWKEYVDKVDKLGEHIGDYLTFVMALKNNYKAMFDDTYDKIDWESWGLTEEQEKAMETILQKYENAVNRSADFTKNLVRETNEKIATAELNELNSLTHNAERIFNDLQEKVKDFKTEPVKRTDFWGKLLGLDDEEKTLSKLEYVKKHWENAYKEIVQIVTQEQGKWDAYIDHIKELYGEDSKQYRKAQEEKIDSLKKLWDMEQKVGKRANTPTSLTNDYNGDDNPDAPKKQKRKLWYGKDDKKEDGSAYNLFENVANLFQSLDEMVLGPAMDTFSMYMDFAIEETQQKLEEVQKMHDKALDKVDESAEKIKELNDSLKDSSNTNLEVTKQQLADEQLLYAQRLAEEKKLQEQEKALKNKAAKQEANARKMELRYQMVMAIANAAQGAGKALAQWGWPTGPIFAAVMAALGAIQVGLIASQIGKIQPVKYAEGGLLSGPSHSQGGIKVGNTGVEVEGNEFVVNKRSTAKYLPLLEAINAEGNKRSFANTDKRMRKYANGGQLNFDRADENLRENNNTNRLISAIDGIDMQPVVAVKDIWKAEDRLIKVRSLAGR